MKRLQYDRYGGPEVMRLAEFEPPLAALVGRRLSAVWLVWDRDDDTWFADAPVLLGFEGEQVELCHQCSLRRRGLRRR